MSRRNKFLIWLIGILGLLGLIYASLPWLLTNLIKQNLKTQGLTDVQLRVNYPGWRGIELHSIAFTVMAGENHIKVEVPGVDVAFHLAELITGTVARIRVPVVNVRIQSTPGNAPSAQTAAVLPVATLLSGQWISDIPVRELLLEQLRVEARTSADAVYSMQLSGQLRDAQLQVNGDIRLPKPAQRPIVFSLNAQHTGEARLVVSSIDQTAAPMLALTLNPVTSDRDTIEPNQNEISGAFTVSLNELLPVLVPWLTGADWAAGLEGNLTSQWQAKVTNLSWHITGEAAVQGLGGRFGDQVLPRGEWTAKYDADPQRVTLHSSLRAEQAVVVETIGLHEFASGHGHADLKLLPLMFSDSDFVLSHLLKDWPYVFDVTAGRVSGSARLTWQQAFDVKGVVQLDQLGGHYNKTAFAGLSGNVAVELVNSKRIGMRTSKDAQLRVDVVDVGFPVEQIAVRFGLVPQPKTMLPLVRVQAFSAQLLGGKAHSGPFELDFGRDANSFVLQLEGIGLNEIMKLEQQEGLAGSGMLDGQLPIEISSEGIVVIDGRLSARAPGGDIRYTPTVKVAALAQSNPGVSMMVKALSNFQYEVLDVNTDYKRGGDLILQVRLEGKNPEWQGGQPVHLNLNLEENIPALLRSLQLSNDISERVRKRYQDIPKGKAVK